VPTVSASYAPDTQQHSLVTAAKEADASFHKTISGEFDAYALRNAL